MNSKMRVLSLVLCLAGCTNSTLEEPSQKTPQQPAAQGENVGIDGNALTATIPVTLKEESFRGYDINTGKMSYKVSYHENNVAGEIEFVAGKAALKFLGFPAGRAGKFTFEILESSVVKFRGVEETLSLVAGENNLRLKLKPVDMGTTTTVDLEIDPSTTTPVTPVTPPVTPPSPPPVPGALSFSADIKSQIMEANCTECHHAGKSLDFSKFPFSSGDQAALAARVISVVSGGAAASMPPGNRPKLNAAQVEKLVKWKNDGLRP